MNATLKQWGNSVGIRIPKDILENSNLQVNDILEIQSFNGGLTLHKKTAKTFSDIAKPLVNTRDWTFDREEANERR